MKRSRTTALLLMSTAPLWLSACQKQVQVQEGLYTSVESCVQATGEPSTCRAAFEQASKASADTAPRYANVEECRKDYPADQCVQQQTSTGHSFIGPMMTGFFLSQMMNNNRSGLAQPPAAAPAWRDNANGWARSETPNGTGGLNTSSRIGNGKAGLTPVTSTPNRAVTVSRGGFGRSSSGRSSGRSSFGG